MYHKKTGMKPTHGMKPGTGIIETVGLIGDGYGNGMEGARD